MSFHGDLLKHHIRVLRLFHNCSKLRSLKATKALHAIAVTRGPIPNQTLFVGNNLLSMYASVGELSVSHQLFDQMPDRNVVSCNTLIGAYSKLGFVEQAWKMFSDVRRAHGFNPTEFTFGGLMSCETLDYERGAQLHACVVKNGLFCSNAFVGTSLIGFYGRSRAIEEAVCAFEDMPCKTQVTWNSTLSLLGRSGFVESCVFLFRELVRMGLSFCSEFALSSVILGFSSNKDRSLGEHIHGFSVKLGLVNRASVSNSLINMYSKCSTFDSAEQIFDETNFRDVVTWNSIIGAAAKSSSPERAFRHFLEMTTNGVSPNSTSFVNIMGCCASLGLTSHGEKLHAKLIANGLSSNIFVGTALTHFYSSHDELKSAQLCFDEIFRPNLVSWNALIHGYSKKCPKISTMLLRGMLRFGHEPNDYTLSAVFKSLPWLELSQVHCLAIRTGRCDNRFVLSSLVTSYAKNGLVSDALALVTAPDSPLQTVPFNIAAGIFNQTGYYEKTLELLSRLDEPDRVSWNILMESFARNGCHEEALELLKEMNLNGIYPDNFTFVTLLTISASRLDLALGSSVHALILKFDFDRCDTIACNVLVDMYRKCGSLSDAVRAFEEIKDTKRNLVTWTILISALGTSGQAREALKRFEEMESAGIEPDSVALGAVLTACRHGGLVTEGEEVFRRTKTRYQSEPEIQHYQNIVNMLTKHGRVTRQRESYPKCLILEPP